MDLGEAASAARAGDRDAFGRGVECCHDGLRAFIAARLDDPAQVDDVVQNTFLAAFRRIGDFRSDGSMPAWLRGIAVNLLRNLRRRTAAIGGDAAAEVAVVL